jgi:hypothetical protein
MRLAAVLGAFFVVALAAPSFAGTKARRPRLDARAAPRITMSPARVLVTVELVGGEDVEDFYCPGLDWDWGDGSRSFRESDCDPFVEGTRLERRFSEWHLYRSPGAYAVRVTLRHARRTLASTSAQVTVGGYVAALEP